MTKIRHSELYPPIARAKHHFFASENTSIVVWFNREAHEHYAYRMTLPQMASGRYAEDALKQLLEQEKARGLEYDDEYVPEYKP